MNTHGLLTEDSRRTHGALTYQLTEEFSTDSRREGKGGEGSRKGKGYLYLLNLLSHLILSLILSITNPNRWISNAREIERLDLVK